MRWFALMPFLAWVDGSWLGSEEELGEHEMGYVLVVPVLQVRRDGWQIWRFEKSFLLVSVTWSGLGPVWQSRLCPLSLLLWVYLLLAVQFLSHSCSVWRQNIKSPQELDPRPASVDLVAAGVDAQLKCRRSQGIVRSMRTWYLTLKFRDVRNGNNLTLDHKFEAPLEMRWPTPLSPTSCSLKPPCNKRLYNKVQPLYMEEDVA